MKQATVCLVPGVDRAEAIVDALKTAGFCNSDISILMPDQSGPRDAAIEKHSKAPEGTSTGAGTGALLGGALGWLAGIGSLAIPGLGPLIAAGPIMAALGGAAVGGAVGGVTGGLIGLGMPEYEAKQYEGKLLAGQILLSVHTENNDQAKAAEEIFKTYGGVDISRMGEEKMKKAG